MTRLWALAMASQAGATCPDPGAMAAGITIESAAQTTTYRSDGGDVRTLTVALDGRYRVSQTLALGLIAQTTTADFADPAIPDQTTFVSLPIDLALPPAPGATLALPARITDQNTGQSDEVVIHLTAGQPGRIRIGDCLLTGLPVTLRHERPGAAVRTDLVWLEDYGFAYLARRQFETFPEEVFPPTGIVAQ